MCRQACLSMVRFSDVSHQRLSGCVIFLWIRLVPHDWTLGGHVRMVRAARDCNLDSIGGVGEEDRG